jgi:3-phosphoshikimate 1-carboxyvinyltransferase
MNHQTTVVVRPARGLAGSVRLPGDKSISHRYALLGAIAQGATKLENFSTGADCSSTLGCVRTLGAEWERKNGWVVIQGRGLELQKPKSPLDCGNSGSTMRMLSGILAGQEFSSELIGDESLSRRPMARIIRPLTLMGAQIESGDGGRPPLHITGGKLRGIDYSMPVASAQVKTALLFAGLYAQGETSVAESVRTRDHGELALRAFGAELKHDGNTVKIAGRQQLRGMDATLPGDLSSAAFFLCAAALFPGSQLTLPALLMNPTRARLLDLLISLGVAISVTQLEESQGELMGTVQVEGRTLGYLKVAGADTAAVIDEIPVLAAIAPFTAEGIEIRDAGELRVKESDRITAVAEFAGHGSPSGGTGRRLKDPWQSKTAWSRTRLLRRSPHCHGVCSCGSARRRRDENQKI